MLASVYTGSGQSVAGYASYNGFMKELQALVSHHGLEGAVLPTRAFAPLPYFRLLVNVQNGVRRFDNCGTLELHQSPAVEQLVEIILTNDSHLMFGYSNY